MKTKIKALLGYLELNNLELESLVFNKGKLNFQVSDKSNENIVTATSSINQNERAKLKVFMDSPITQEQVNKVINTVVKDEKITDYKFCLLNFYGFRYNERGYFIKERKNSENKITDTFIMYPSNRESNSKTRWTFKRYNDKGIEITFYGDLTFKSYEEVEQFFFRNGVVKCD